MELAERLADRIVIINNGRLVADGTLTELRMAHGRESMCSEFGEEFEVETDRELPMPFCSETVRRVVVE